MLELALVVLVLAALGKGRDQVQQQKKPAPIGDKTDHTARDILDTSGQVIGVAGSLVATGVSLFGGGGGGAAAAAAAGGGAGAGVTGTAETAAAGGTAQLSNATGLSAALGEVYLAAVWIVWVMLIGAAIENELAFAKSRNLRLQSGFGGLQGNFRMRIHNIEREYLESLIHGAGMDFTRGGIPQSLVDAAAAEPWTSSSIATVTGALHTRSETGAVTELTPAQRDAVLICWNVAARYAAIERMRVFNDTIRRYYVNVWTKSVEQIEAEGSAMSSAHFTQLANEYWRDHPNSDWGLELRHPAGPNGVDPKIVFALQQANDAAQLQAYVDQATRGAFWTWSEAVGAMSGTTVQEQNGFLGKAQGVNWVAGVALEGWSILGTEGYAGAANRVFELGLEVRGKYLVDANIGYAFAPEQAVSGDVVIKGLDDAGAIIATGNDVVDRTIWETYLKARGLT